MVRIMRIEKLRECLGALRGLVARYEGARDDFTELALNWLDKAETLLREERLPEATDVLTARTSVLSADDRSKAAGQVGVARRRASALAAVDALCHAEALLRKQLLANEEKIDAYEDKLVEAITALIVLGHLPPMDDLGGQAWASRVWDALASQQATRPTAVWLSAALASPDRMVLLHRVLDRVLSSDLPVLVSARAPTAVNPESAGPGEETS